MSKKYSKLLVVDASVLQASSSNNSSHPVGTCCRRVLEEIYRICHRAFATRDIQREWRTHSSSFSMRWQTQMASRGKLLFDNKQINAELRLIIEKSVDDKNDRSILLKDSHLLEAANAADRIIISLDNNARDCFVKHREKMKVWLRVAWKNPTDSSCIPWLKAGAKLTKNDNLA